MYQSHPSEELNAQFRHRPYQGVEPSAATFLFVGLDANYSATIERSPSFQSVLEYHQDGVAFWRRYGVHHPFLLPEYRGDGRRYHRAFARIGFTPGHATLVSFAELLHVPTVGRNKLVPQDFDPAHLHRLDAAIRHGNAKHIFVSASVARLMQASKTFPWLLNESVASRAASRSLQRAVTLCVFALALLELRQVPEAAGHGSACHRCSPAHRSLTNDAPGRAPTSMRPGPCPSCRGAGRRCSRCCRPRRT